MNRLAAVIVALLFASLPVVHAVELKLSYDANGNLVTGDGKYRVYNGLNQLARVYNGTNATGLLLEEYTYHPTQERILVKKVYNNDTSLKETTYYVTKTFVQVVNSSGTYNITYVYHDGQLVAQNTNGTKLFIHGDQKGSTTVVTSDATTGNTSGSLPQQIFQDSFCSSDRGYTGYDARDSSQCSLNKTNSYGNIVSPNEGFETNYTDNVADFNLTVVFRYPGGTNNKFYPTVTCASLGSTSNRFNFEQGNSTHFHIKADRGGWSSTNDVPYNTTQTARFETNATTNRSRACIGTSCTNWETYTRDAGAEDCFATSFNSISGGAFQIYNVTGWQNLKPYNTTGTNVTIIETSTYSPFGERLNNSQVRLGYEAKEADTTVGDTDFNFRKYRPDLGIFTQPDTFLENAYDPQLLNRYAFERNNPHKYRDPNGHMGEQLLGAIGEGATAVGAVAAVVASSPATAIVGVAAVAVGVAYAGNYAHDQYPPEQAWHDYQYLSARGGDPIGDLMRRTSETFKKIGELNDIASTTQHDNRVSGQQDISSPFSYGIERYGLTIFPSNEAYRAIYSDLMNGLQGTHPATPAATPLPALHATFITQRGVATTVADAYRTGSTSVIISAPHASSYGKWGSSGWSGK